MPTKTKKLNEINAVEALVESEFLKLKVEALKEKHGINDLEKEAARLKDLATGYCVENSVEQLYLPDGRHATLIAANYGGRWIGTEDEMRGDEPAGCIPLRTIIKRKFKRDPQKAKMVWMRCTKRIVDHEAVEEVVNEGILTVSDVEPAFYEKQKKPFLRIFV